MIRVIKPSNCINACKLTMLISSAGNAIPYRFIIQMEPSVDPMINMTRAVITKGLLGLKIWLFAI
jgi:hypothetical protein